MPKHFFFTVALFTAFAVFVQAETVYIDDLDVSKALSGWQETKSRKSVEGTPISIAGKRFDRGVGIHPANVDEKKAEIRVLLPLADGKFTVQVGINDDTNGAGNAEFLVYLDEKEVWRSGFMRGKQEAKPCEISFTKENKLLQLVVDAGPDYGHDHTDWADAKLEFTGGQRKPAIEKSIINAPPVVDRDDEYAYTFRQLKTGIPANRAAHALRVESTFLPTDRNPVDVVLRRTKALLASLIQMPEAPNLEKESAELAKIETEYSAESPEEKLREVFTKLTALRDRIALKNPLLDFSDILFIKRHYNPEPEKQGNHMVDQFFGFHAVPGGGMFILQNAFDPEKRTVRNILEQSTIENDQRLKGIKLDHSWGYLAPELSFDGTRILFAAADTSEQRHSYQWTEGNCYHLFEVGVDGSHLVQLTDGPWNDIDPCYLPGGRIAFISERRGGYGRCHARPCPSYTLHSMLPDGSDIVVLSPHETNEWAPSVDHNGMIVYTRWDYVDRGFNQAHHPWITMPDGRDPRALQGNYSERENSRPQFETTFRAIPNSHKLVGTAMGHHSQYFGSVILLDPNVPDDEEGGDPMAPLRRITPEQPFPEVENRSHQDSQDYGQPFPISEDFYLVVYDPFSGMGKGHANNYAIYLMDSFGNRTLLYRDSDISCQCPIAMKPRPTPPVIPNRTLVGLSPGVPATMSVNEIPKTATVGVINVYITNRPFPEGTKIKELRIVQVLPKTTWNANDPWIGYGGDNSARKVLGTVPVLEDGSARFEMPVDVPVYFQTLDENGFAVQTMRSATYVKPGETLTCLGCHEGRNYGTSKPTIYPAAFRRPASTIKPDVEGSDPFSYTRMIQPIWDKHCVECHAQAKAEGKSFGMGRTLPAAQIGPKVSDKLAKHFFESYINLNPHVFIFSPKWNLDWGDQLPSHGGAHTSFTAARTFPGQFGANRSPLWRILREGHYDVKLSPEELRAVALWLDNNADFYGAYEFDTLESQRAGEIVKPTLE